MENLINLADEDKLSEITAIISQHPNLLYELNQQGINLLNYCIDTNKSQIAEQLILVQQNIDFQDHFGMTALHYAVKNNFIGC